LLFVLLSITSSAVEENNRTFKDHALLIGMNLSGMNLPGTRLNHSDFDAKLAGTNLSGVTMVQGDLHGSDLSRADLRGAYMPICNLFGSNLTSAIPCGLMVNELVTNAFKFAFPEGRPRPGEQECEIAVTAAWDGSAYTLTVRDNGVGLPADLDWRATQSLGLQLVVMFGKYQLNGQIELDRSGGTTFRLRFAPKNHNGS
jgi:uncharacterized protein YjbI with pentapeptide repeats